MQTLSTHHAKGKLIKFIFERMNQINGGRGVGAAHSGSESAAQRGEFEKRTTGLLAPLKTSAKSVTKEVG